MPSPQMAGLRACSVPFVTIAMALAQRVDGEIPAPDVSEILVGHARMEPCHALQPGVCSDPVKAEQQPRPQDRSIETLVGGRAFQRIGEIEAQIGFLDHVEQAGHRPGRGDFGLDRGQSSAVRAEASNGVTVIQPSFPRFRSIRTSGLRRQPGVESLQRLRASRPGDRR